MNRDESMALVVDASFLALCAMRTLEVRRSSRRAALRTSPPAHRRLVALSAAAPPPPPPLQVALECHSTLPPGWRDEAAAKRWAAVLAAIYVPTQPLPKQGGTMLLPFDGAQYANATPRTWALGNAQQLLAHGLPARVPGPPCRSLRTLRHQQI